MSLFHLLLPSVSTSKFSSSQRRPSSLCSIYCTEYEKSTISEKVIRKGFSKIYHVSVDCEVECNRKNNKVINIKHKASCIADDVENAEMSVTEAVNMVVISDITIGS